MDFLMNNWGAIAIGVPALITVLGVVAELTPFEWDNKAIKAARTIWAKIPIFSRDPKTMGTGK